MEVLSFFFIDLLRLLNFSLIMLIQVEAYDLWASPAARIMA